MILVLRYSSYSHNTVTEHDNLVGRNGETWWGWWKKLHEPWPTIFDTHIASGQEIGLVDRSSGEYFVATCRAIASDNGLPIPSPNPQATPEYYAQDSHPAWFNFSEIRKLHRAAWERKFGTTPVGEETLYVNPAHTPLQAGAAIDTLTTTAPPDRTGILHISDLHFGGDHAFHTKDHIEQTQLIDQLIDALPEPPAAVIVSGDLTTRGDGGGLTNARLFLEELAVRVELPRENFIIVPGNHDILVDDEASVKNMSNEQQFRDFVRLFYSAELELERIHDLTLDNGQQILFGASNSSKYRANVFMDYGYLGWKRIQPVMAELNNLSANENSYKIFVLHHHLQSAIGNEEPTESRPVSITLDAGDLVTLASTYGVDALAHGHQHLPFVGSVGRVAQVDRSGPSTQLTPAPVMTLGAGSLSVQASRLGDELRMNSFSFYNLHEASFRIRTYQFTPMRTPEQIWDFVVPRN